MAAPEKQNVITIRLNGKEWRIDLVGDEVVSSGDLMPRDAVSGLKELFADQPGREAHYDTLLMYDITTNWRRDESAEVA